MCSIWNVACVFISTGYFRSWCISLVCLNYVGSSSWIVLQIGKKGRRNRTESKILVIVSTCAYVSLCVCLHKRLTVANWVLYKSAVLE